MQRVRYGRARDGILDNPVITDSGLIHYHP
jgi:hypothetical protein